MTVADQLQSIIGKTANLVDMCITLQEENENLRSENQSIKEALASGKNKNQELEEKLRAATVARSLEALPAENAGSSEKALDIKQKISEFVREIDKCIVLLKK